MAGKYETQVDLKNRNNSHALIVDLVGKNKKVLDVGAANGYIAEILSERGCRVTGIELDSEAAKQAEEFCERVITGDVESMDLDGELGDETFDVIVFGDLLEHLKDPLKALERFKPFLSLGGYVVTSIPNIAHGSVRLALLQGKFQYRSLGLLDDTHLRFFTLESVEQLFTDAGFVIDELERTKRGIFNTEIEVDRERVSEDTLEVVQSDPEALTYQFVLTAYLADGNGVAARSSNEVRLLWDRLERKDEMISERDRKIYDISRKLRNLDELQRQLKERDRQLEDRGREVANLTQEVASRNQQLANREKKIQQLERQLERLRREK